MMKRIAALAILLAVWLTTPGAQRQAESPSVPDELLVKFRSTSSQARRTLALNRRNARALRHFDALDIDHIALPRGQRLEAALAELRVDPDVLYVQPNYIRRTTSSALPNDPYWLSDNLWGLKKIKAPEVWETYGTGSNAVVVASIDTGVNYNHSDLAANIWTNPGEIAGNGIDDDHNGYVDDVHGINALTHSGDPMDDHGHGTHTAGTMAAVGNNGVGIVGVNWNARILACKFMNAAGSGNDAGAIECFNYLTQQKQRGVNIRVSNNSWGGARDGGVPTALKAAIDAAGQAGILNVCAAGNNGTNNVTAPVDPASLTSASIIAVAASNSDDSRAGFSNYGTNVHLAAPGAWIMSTFGSNYGELSGTSMSAPHVAGAVALMASLSPSTPATAIKDLLISNVDVLPEWSGLVNSGGRLNVLKAVQGLVGGVALTSQTLLTTQVPDGEYRDGGGITYELGVRLRSDVAGQITALRYWKASLENGPHVGRVWTAAGQLLATVTFTGETAVGWQQQALATPVAVTANTDYIVSVSTGANGYYVSTDGLAAVLTNGHLTTVAPNGGRYGALGSFPGNSSVGNYFRDVVFVPGSGAPDTTAPTVSVTQPAGGSAVSGTVTLAATASDNVGVTGVQFRIDGANVGAEQTAGPYSLAWDSSTVANGAHTVTAVARDAAGLTTTSAGVTVTVTNAAPPAGGQQTLLTTQVPDGEYRDGGGITYELGVRLRSDVAGQITALRYWKASLENGPHVGRVWTAAGQLLATVTFTGETAVGWQQQALPTPVAVMANVDYIVSVSTGSNGYYVAANTFTTVVTNGPLSTSGGRAGRYGPLGSMPVYTCEAGCQYFRDVVFVPDVVTSLEPNPISPSDLKVRLDFVAQTPTFMNLTSPAAAGTQLLLPDQGGFIYRWDGTDLTTLLTPATFPAGIFPPGGESVLNVAANQAGTLVYVMYSTFTQPAGVPISSSPRPSDSWQVLYEYSFNGTTLSNARAIRAFQVRSDSHTGGGLLVLADGTVLAAIGDNGDAGEDGRSFAQDPSNHLSKIVRVAPQTGAVSVVAIGVRNVQRLARYSTGPTERLDFADIGGAVAEELNSILLADLLAGPVHNFGWGRHADGNAREGTFYINPDGAVAGAAPTPEPGFVQPVAQFGREGRTFIAVSGPVSSTVSFSQITSMIGDLPTGEVYAVTGSLTQPVQPVYRVSLFDSASQPVTLASLAGGRPDVRFFNFPDGTAGLLLERTGRFYRLTEIR